MKTRYLACIVILIGIGVLGASVSAASAVQVNDLRCEYAVNPLGVDVLQPRLFWKLTAVTPGTRHQYQTAYQILVASSSAALDAGNGDIWDSGKVVSGQSTQLTYGGPALVSNTSYFWKVRCWDKSDRPSDWSETAYWSMGLLNGSDWQAQWIGSWDDSSVAWDDAQWIWYPEGNPASSAPPAARYFRRSFTIVNVSQIESASCIITADDAFEMFVNGQSVYSDNQVDGWKSVEVFDIAQHLQDGNNVLAVRAINNGLGANPAGWIGKISINLQPGSLDLNTSNQWLTSNTEQSNWNMVGFDDSSWANSLEMGQMGIGPWGTVSAVSSGGLPIFRKGFDVSKTVEKALVYVTGLGHYRLSLNGQQVGDQFMAQAWTMYDKTVFYDTYDITSQLQSGENCFGMMLGKGFYDTEGDRRIHGVNVSRPLKLCLQTFIRYTDGSTETVLSDGSWKVTAGPITHNAVIGGSDYDARKLPAGWDTASFDDSAWSAATVTTSPAQTIKSAYGVPLKSYEVFTPVSVNEPQPGYFVYNFGQNTSSRPRITVQGQAGQQIRLTPSEQRQGQTNNQNDGTGRVSQSGMGSPQYCVYTLSGDGEETWSPAFYYTGFQYIEAYGAVPEGEPNPDNLPVIKSIQAIHSRAAMPVVGSFECSNELFNKIHKLVDWAVQTNSAHVSTDCPHREKLGWLEQSYLMGPSSAWIYDISRYYTKICMDIRDSQTANGKIYTVAPNYPAFSGGFRYTPEWGAAGVFNPWILYQWYGDRKVLEDNYVMMKGFVDYMESTSTDLVPIAGLGDWYDYGHGQSPGASRFTPLELSAMEIFHMCTKIVADTAGVLGNTSDQTAYQQLADNIKSKFNEKYFNDTDEYTNNGSCQTANSMALVAGLVPAGKEQAVLQKIIDDIRARGNQQTSGDIGHRFLITALRNAGRSDVIFDMTNRTNTGSYGGIVTKGWTSMPETWNVNLGLSLNHMMLGHIQEWMQESLVGITPDPQGPGFKKFIINPQPVDDITWANGQHQCPYGLIKSHWTLQNNQFTLNIEVPVNTEATVYIPAADPTLVMEGAGQAQNAVGVTFLRTEDGWAVFRVKSGVYSFRASQNAEPKAVKIAEWRIDELSATEVPETFGQASGLLQGQADWVRGFIGNCTTFDQPDEYIDMSVPMNWPFDADRAFSVSGYFKTLDEYGPIFSFRNDTDDNPIFGLHVGAEGLHFNPGELLFIARDAGESISNVQSATTVNDGLWHSFAITRSAEGIFSVYLDGELKGTVSDSALAYDVNYNALGKELRWELTNWQSANPVYHSLEGAVDEFVLWDGVLSSEQIAYYVAPLPGDVNRDMFVDIFDIRELAGNWVENAPGSDINGSGRVDLEDFSHICSDWVIF